jgi:gluconate 5-dehydrogenase
MMHPLFDLSGRVALITGSSRGIGAALARALASAGARIVLNGRDPASLEAARATLSADGIECTAASFDVADEAGATSAIAAVECDFGPIDILVNNSGITVRRPLEDFETADWDRIMAIELTAPLVADREFTGWLEKRVPMGRWGDAKDLGGAAIFLASAASDFMTGQLIDVDGGLTASV